MKDYATWIAAHAPIDPRGQCSDMTTRMAAAFPELVRTRGHYVCADHRHPHWWLIAPDGTVIDPTVEQFAMCGGGLYEPYLGPEPKGHCLDCGELLFSDTPFCNDECARRCVEWMQAGGSIWVNGQQVLP